MRLELIKAASKTAAIDSRSKPLEKMKNESKKSETKAKIISPRNSTNGFDKKPDKKSKVLSFKNEIKNVDKKSYKSQKIENIFKEKRPLAPTSKDKKRKLTKSGDFLAKKPIKKHE